MNQPLDEQTLDSHVRETVRLSLDHVKAGGIPFAGMVIAPDGTVIGTGVNRVEADRDPLAHAEVVALREACRATGRLQLTGCVLIASGEPCALCCLAARYCGIAEILHAVDRYGAAKAGFDYTSSYRMLALDPGRWTSPRVRAAPVEDAFGPFVAWQRRRFP